MSRYDRDENPDEICDSSVRRPPEPSSGPEISNARGQGGGSGTSQDKPLRHETRPSKVRSAPHGRRTRHPDLDRDRTYALRDSELKTLSDIGTFRVLRLDDLVAHRYGGDPAEARRDLDNLRRQGLILRRTTHPEKTVYVTLTKAAHRFLEGSRLQDSKQRQALYHGFVKPRDLQLAPKSKTHVRSLLHSLVEYAMWSGILDISRNPISLVQNNGATRGRRKARSLTVDQFHALLRELHEPFATMALLCVCLGLRISEALALQWADVDWLNSLLSIKRGIVEQVVDECKTAGSAKTVTLADDLFNRLKSWKQLTEFSGAEDWIFASPFNIGRLPYSYGGTRDELARAGKASGIGHVSTHAFRHTYRSWLDAVGTAIAVQQKMMRHTDIRTTMNVYGDVVTDEMTTASSRVARLAFQTNGAQAERKAS